MSRVTTTALMIALLGGFLAGPARAAPDAPAPAIEPGLFVTVGNPITSAVVTQVKETVAQAIKNRDIKKVVFDFNPDGKEAASTDIGPCLDLARYIRQLRNDGKVVTIGFVRAKTTRHTVLPVLACDKRVMAPEASFGAVTENAQATPDRGDVAIYETFVTPGQAALVVKMLDAKVEVLEGLRNNAVYYLEARREAEATREGVTVVSRTPVLRAGALGLYRAAEARKFELCEALAATRQQVEQLYALPPGSHKEDPLAERQRVPWRITVSGELTPGRDASLRRHVDRAVKRGGNLIFLQIEAAAGGNLETARGLADYLRNLRGPEGQPVMTVAFVPHGASDYATFLALACN